MRPQYQVILTPPEGDCFRTCLACIMDLDRDDVPNYHFDLVMDEIGNYNEWLRDANLYLAGIQYEDDDPDRMPDGYVIMTCTPPPDSRGQTYNHCVVFKNRKPIWNPMPSYGEDIGDIGEYRYYEVLVVLDPSKPVRRQDLSLETKKEHRYVDA